MGCCTYVPKFPAWNIAVKIWKWNFGLSHHVRELPDITGQIQAQEQNAAVGDAATAYFRYPKEHDRLRDIWDYSDSGVYDAVSFLLPGGREVFYKVREVQGMNFTFPNAHLVATLDKLSYVDAVEVQPPYDPPVDPEVDDDLSTFVAAPPVIDADGVETATGTLTLRYSDGSLAGGIPVTLTSTGSVAVSSSDTVTDLLTGVAEIVGTNAFEETTNFAAVWTGGSKDSNTVEWIDGGPVDPGIPTALNAYGASNGTCSDCLSLCPSSPLTLSVTGTGVCQSDSITYACGTGEAIWTVYYDAGTFTWTVNLEEPGRTMASYYTTSTPSGGALSVPFVAGFDDCIWPSIVTLSW